MSNEGLRRMNDNFGVKQEIYAALGRVKLDFVLRTGNLLYKHNYICHAENNFRKEVLSE